MSWIGAPAGDLAAAVGAADRLRLGVGDAPVDLVQAVVAPVPAHLDSAEVELGAVGGVR